MNLSRPSVEFEYETYPSQVLCLPPSCIGSREPRLGKSLAAGAGEI